MNRTRQVSRPVWALFAFSALLGGAVWFVSHRVRPLRWVGDAELEALTTDREALRASDDTTRDALRAQQQLRLQSGWTEEQLAELPKSLGAGWRCEWLPAGAGERRAVVTRVAPRLQDWPVCVAMVRRWAGAPGVRLDSLDIAAEGTGRRRQFTQVLIGLRFTLAAAPKGNAERPAPSRGALPVAPAAEPTTTRPAGPVPSLRPPVSAPFRSDPPGDRAGERAKISNHQPREKTP